MSEKEWPSQKTQTSPKRGGGVLTEVERVSDFAQAKAGVLELSGAATRLSWRTAHDRARQSGTALDAEASAEAGRWRALYLIAVNQVSEAMSVLSEVKKTCPEADLRGIVAAAHLSRQEFRSAAQAVGDGADMDCKIALAVSSAHQISDTSLGDAASLFTSSEEYRAQSIGAELAAQLSFMRGDVSESNRWAERAIDAGTELVDGWRDGERWVLDASSLLARGSLESFQETCEQGLLQCRDMEHQYSEYRLLHLQLHLATLQDDRQRRTELRQEMERLKSTIPPLFLDGPLYGLGRFLAQAERDLGDYRASNAQSIADHLDPVMKAGFAVAVDRPILLGRIQALAAVRLKRTRGVQRRFEEAIDFADERGWVIEAAIARIQLGEVAPHIKMARPDTSEAEAVLESLGIAWRPIALTASRAGVLSLRTTALTMREQEVIDLLAEGLNVPEIAKRLKIGQETVRSHVKSVKGKQGMDGMTGAKATALLSKAKAAEVQAAKAKR